MIIKFNKYYNKKKCRQIIIICIIFLFFHFLDLYKSKCLDNKSFKIKEFEILNSKSFIENFFFENYIEEIKKFREINDKNILNHQILFQKVNQPDISVIITVYNQANCFFKALRSVQNQSFKNIEIIIIDDCSLDNTTEVIEKYMKEDKRIIYLKNDSNNGKIKTRSDAVMIAKGKYITIIDGDDALSHQNILFNSFTIANLANLDVVEFRYGFFEMKNLLKLNDNLNNINKINHRIIYQPELSIIFIDLIENDSVPGFANRSIWGKLIKNDIFKKVLEFIGPKYTEDYLLDFEDTIMSVALFQVANSYYYMDELGYYKSEGELNNSFPLLKYKTCINKNLTINKELDSIKYLNFLLDISEGGEIENKLIFKELVVIDHVRKLDKILKTNFSYVYSILDKIKNLNINTKQKDQIKKIEDKLIQKEKFLQKEK